MPCRLAPPCRIAACCMQWSMHPCAYTARCVAVAAACAAARWSQVCAAVRPQTLTHSTCMWQGLRSVACRAGRQPGQGRAGQGRQVSRSLSAGPPPCAGPQPCAGMPEGALPSGKTCPVTCSCCSRMPTPSTAVNDVCGPPSARLRIRWKGCGTKGGAGKTSRDAHKSAARWRRAQHEQQAHRGGTPPAPPCAHPPGQTASRGPRRGPRCASRHRQRPAQKRCCRGCGRRRRAAGCRPETS